MKLSDLQRPFVCAVIAEPDVGSTIIQVDSLEKSRGVDAFEINIPQLPVGSLRDIFASTNKPCVATCRRSNFMKLYGYDSLPTLTSEERARKLMKALSEGASTIDFELDIFDETPISNYAETTGRFNMKNLTLASHSEISNKPNVVKQQKEFAIEAKKMGGEVLIACHTRARIERNTILEIGQNIESRKADLAKIVTLTSDTSDLVVLLDTAAKMKHKLTIPFNLMNMGHQAVLGRLLSIVFGSSWIYCRADSKYSFRGQPTVSEARRFIAEYVVH